MRINSIINRYIFMEMIPPFIINIVFFTFIFLMTNILDITNMAVNYNVGIASVFLMLIYAVPYFMVFVIPMSIMTAVLLTFLRLSSDNEIIALKSGGMSIYGLLPPVFLFCLSGCIFTAFMTIYGLPWGRTSIKELTCKIVASNLDLGLKERAFNDSFKDVMLYTGKIDLKNNELINIFIEDGRSDEIVSTIVAPRGRLFSEPGELSFQLRLYNGTINRVDIDKRSVQSINFDTYNVTLDLKRAAAKVKKRSKDEKEMSLDELRRHLKDATQKDSDYYSMLIEFHRKFAIPFACFALGILAVPLGIQSKSSKKSFGLGLGLIFFLLYYLLLSAGSVFGETGAYPPVIGMWVPNIVMSGTGIFLLIRTANERPVKINFFKKFINLNRIKS